MKNAAELFEADVFAQHTVHQSFIIMVLHVIWRHHDHFSIHPFGADSLVSLPIPFDKFLFGHAFGRARRPGSRARAIPRLSLAHNRPSHATSPLVIFINASSKSASTSLNQTSETSCDISCRCSEITSSSFPANSNL